MAFARFNAHTLQPLWERPDILSSSHCPVLADVDGDGVLDVIIENQRDRIYVLNALTGVSEMQTSSMPMPGHYQPVVNDIDNDGHLEVILPMESMIVLLITFSSGILWTGRRMRVLMLACVFILLSLVM